MRIPLFCLVITPIILLAGCAYTVPLTREATLEGTAPMKGTESILLVMSPEEAGKIIEYSPQLGDTYVFEGGPALKDLLLNVLGQVYVDVFYAESHQGRQSPSGISIEAGLRSYEVVMNVRTGHTVDLVIEYVIRNSMGEVVETLETNTSSTDSMSAAQKVGIYTLTPLYAIGKNKDKVGAAWDMAALSSIQILLETLEGIDV